MSRRYLLRLDARLLVEPLPPPRKLPLSRRIDWRSDILKDLAREKWPSIAEWSPASNVQRDKTDLAWNERSVMEHARFTQVYITGLK